jgi:hypothetical protein
MRNLFIFAVLLAASFLHAQGGIGGMGGIGGKGGIGGGHSSGGGVTWTLIQSPHNFSCTANTNTCAVTVASTTAGNLGLLVSSGFTGGGGGSPTYSSITGDTFTHCPSQYANETSGNSETTDCGYVLSLAGGATSLTFNWSGSMNQIDMQFFEFHRSTGTASVDTCGGGGATACTTTSASCSTCAGPTPTVTGSADVVIQWIAQDTGCTAIASPYSNSPGPYFNNAVASGYAWSLSQTSGNASSWTCTADFAAMAAIAFK